MLVRLYDQREWTKLAPSRIFPILAIKSSDRTKTAHIS